MTEKKTVASFQLQQKIGPLSEQAYHAGVFLSSEPASFPDL